MNNKQYIHGQSNGRPPPGFPQRILVNRNTMDNTQNGNDTIQSTNIIRPTISISTTSLQPQSISNGTNIIVPNAANGKASNDPSTPTISQPQSISIGTNIIVPYNPNSNGTALQTINNAIPTSQPQSTFIHSSSNSSYNYISGIYAYIWCMIYVI